MKVQSVSRWALPIACLFWGISSLFAQEGKISGYIFSDYFYEFSHPNATTAALNRNGFQFRRAYFTYDRDLSEKFTVRFRLEMNSPDLTRVQDFGASSTLTPYIKHAYLRWNNFLPLSKLSFGLVGTPTFNLSEEVWGYRSVEKTVMDLRSIAPSSDLGMALEGKLSSAGVLNYTIFVANGTGTRSETDKNKRIYVNVPIKIQGGFSLVPYFDYEGGDDGKSKRAMAFFAGVQKPSFHGGVELFQKVSNKALANNQNRTESGFSIFGAVKALEKIKLFGRYDRYDPNSDLNDDGNALVIAGLDFAADKNVNIMPNVRIESYQVSGLDVNTVGALTLFFRF
ncbi:MAG: hypothetical protein ONB42_03240 [candidate division KSB1 bacterium]|nr:hypothetical protein [candidate division KSB1 bacterium]